MAQFEQGMLLDQTTHWQAAAEETSLKRSCGAKFVFGSHPHDHAGDI
jgi:hypothetical protein